MNIKAIVTNLERGFSGNFNMGVEVLFVDPSLTPPQAVASQQFNLGFGSDITLYTLAEIKTVIESYILGYAISQSFTMTEADIVWASPNLNSIIEMWASPATVGLVSNPKFFTDSKMIAGSNGNVVFNLTVDGSTNGVALFPNNIFLSSLNAVVQDAANNYTFGSFAVTNGNRQLTINAKKLAFTSGNVLLNLLGTLTSVLTAQSNQNAANGTVVNLSIWGN